MSRQNSTHSYITSQTSSMTTLQSQSDSHSTTNQRVFPNNEPFQCSISLLDPIVILPNPSIENDKALVTGLVFLNLNKSNKQHVNVDTIKVSLIGITKYQHASKNRVLKVLNKFQEFEIDDADTDTENEIEKQDHTEMNNVESHNFEFSFIVDSKIQPTVNHPSFSNSYFITVELLDYSLNVLESFSVPVKLIKQPQSLTSTPTSSLYREFSSMLPNSKDNYFKISMPKQIQLNSAFNVLMDCTLPNQKIEVFKIHLIQTVQKHSNSTTNTNGNIATMANSRQDAKLAAASKGYNKDISKIVLKNITDCKFHDLKIQMNSKLKKSSGMYQEEFNIYPTYQFTSTLTNNNMNNCPPASLNIKHKLKFTIILNPTSTSPSQVPSSETESNPDPFHSASTTTSNTSTTSSWFNKLCNTLTTTLSTQEQHYDFEMDVDILDPDLFQSASSNYNANLDASHESYGSELPCYSSVDCLKKNACGYGGYGR
ncbi:unnamed protein product [Ambrosiozyma monospora]|uniref:Unnamed protein product n=1 Tax=Ambrosiozyma monospora TaxID=43982 RepID=A0ACB5TAL1_AMBMO|nr:unnamed protein product [Ambrosiozyma monospora]